MDRYCDGEASQFCEVELAPPIARESGFFCRVASPDKTVLPVCHDEERGQACLPNWSLVVERSIAEPFGIAGLERIVETGGLFQG